MPKQSSPSFDRQVAATYDRKVEKSAPMMDALRFLTRLVLADLPSQARVLCVGAGTGSELFDLAGAFPDWTFTAVEPAPAMIEVCRQRARDNGVEARVTFHQGYLDSLPDSAPFDGATCLLVSHFFMEAQKRGEFFAQIAARLAPGAILVSADLASDMAAPTFADLLETWRRMLEQSGMPVEQYIASLGTSAAVLPPREVEAIIQTGGFESPVLFFQSLLIHAWSSKRAA